MFLLLLPCVIRAQFAPAAGIAGSSAIKKDSSAIINWASGCKITRGWQDISNQSLGYTTVGDSSKAIGAADGVNVVSLGDGGTAVLTFPMPIKNGPGPDFCVFENSFDPGFLELAFVEVSSDGINFTRFAPTSNNQNTVQIGPFDTTSDPAKLNNLAGKYIGGYGTPFDLQELQGIPGIDINNVTHVKIIDVVGCIQAQYATYDKNNNAINDPWATAFASGGFDLDGVGVINQVPAGIKELKALQNSVFVYPTLTSAEVNVISNGSRALQIMLFDIKGKCVFNAFTTNKDNVVNLNNFPSGIYMLRIDGDGGSFTKRIVKTEN